MVLPASAAILYAVLDVPEMDALMEGRRHHVFYWACKRSCADVKLVAGCIASLPCFGYGDVSVGSGRAFKARKIFSRYPAVRLVLTVSFIFVSSLSFFQSRHPYPGGIRGCGLFRVSGRKRSREAVKVIVEYRSPFVKARICRESAFTGSLIRFMLVAGTTKSLCAVRITAKINGQKVCL